MAHLHRYVPPLQYSAYWPEHALSVPGWACRRSIVWKMALPHHLPGSGVIGGIVSFFFTQLPALNASQPVDITAAGASGAIFGVFGAIGVFFIVNRRALGAYGNGAIGQWIFWLGLNLIWGFTTPGIGILDHIGGLVAGIVIALILMPRQKRRSRVF